MKHPHLSFNRACRIRRRSDFITASAHDVTLSIRKSPDSSRTDGAHHLLSHPFSLIQHTIDISSLILHQQQLPPSSYPSAIALTKGTWGACYQTGPMLWFTTYDHHKFVFQICHILVKSSQDLVIDIWIMVGIRKDSATMLWHWQLKRFSLVFSSTG